MIEKFVGFGQGDLFLLWFASFLDSIFLFSLKIEYRVAMIFNAISIEANLLL